MDGVARGCGGVVVAINVMSILLIPAPTVVVMDRLIISDFIALSLSIGMFSIVPGTVLCSSCKKGLPGGGSLAITH